MDAQAEIKLLVEPRTEQRRESTSFSKRTLICCSSGVLVLFAAYCTLGALVSAFSLPVLMQTLFWACLISAAVVTPVTTFYRGKGLLVLVIPAFLLFILTFPEIIEGAKWVAHTISSHFSLWLPVSVLFAETYEPATDPTIFLAATGVLLSLLLGFAICLRRSIIATLAVTAPIIFLTFVITNLNSDVIYLLGLISVYLSLLISSTVEPDRFYKRGMIIIRSFMTAV